MSSLTAITESDDGLGPTGAVGSYPEPTTVVQDRSALDLDVVVGRARVTTAMMQSTCMEPTAAN